MPAKRKPSRYVEVRGEFECFTGSQLLATLSKSVDGISCAKAYWQTGTYRRVVVQSFPDERIILDLTHAMRYAIASSTNNHSPWKIIYWKLGVWPQTQPCATIDHLRGEVRRLRQLGYRRDKNVPLIKGG